jgi:hypothetical protein
MKGSGPTMSPAFLSARNMVLVRAQTTLRYVYAAQLDR